MPLPTQSDRLAELSQALERHKTMALMLGSWAKGHEAVIERSVSTLRSTRIAITQIEREIAECEAAIAKLESQPLEPRE